MEEIIKKQRGGPGRGQGRKKGEPTKSKTFRIKLGLAEYLETQVGNQDAFVNMLIQSYKDQADRLIEKINNLKT